MVAAGEKRVKMLEFSDENNFGVCQSDGQQQFVVSRSDSGMDGC